MIDTLEDEFPEYERPNKSLLKREAQAALDLAKKLVELHEKSWSELEFPQQVIEELYNLKHMTQHVAKKRQLKLVAKLLREVDTTLAVQAVENVVKSRAQDSVAFHMVERWRDKLLQDGDALTEFVGEYHGADVQALRQLIRNAKLELLKGKTTKSSKLLFKLLRDIID
ncbi:MAG: ribosome biogenesis factor YjgA [Ghiorsea sp.]